MKSRKAISISCPKCEFNNDWYMEGDITPSRPLSLTCRRDKYWDEKDQQMYSSPNHCGYKWDIAVTQEQYEKIVLRIAKEILINTVTADLEKELEDEKN